MLDADVDVDLCWLTKPERVEALKKPRQSLETAHNDKCKIIQFRDTTAVE